MVYLLRLDIFLSWVIHKAIENNYHILKGYILYSCTLFLWKILSKFTKYFNRAQWILNFILIKLKMIFTVPVSTVHGSISSHGQSDYFLYVLKVTNFDKIENILSVSTPKINVMRLN